MCPAMIEEPIAPGRGLNVYQPATAVLTGTFRAPDDVTPSLISLVRTPIAGMIRLAGLATRSPSDGCGTGAACPRGTATSVGWPVGRAPWPELLAMARPHAPVPIASSPQSSTATAPRLLTGRNRRCRCRGGPAPRRAAACRPADFVISPHAQRGP